MLANKVILYFIFLFLEEAIADSDSSAVDSEISSGEMEDRENVSFLNKVDLQGKWK